MAGVQLLDAPDQVRLALTPIRRRLLQRLREPASATQVAAELGLGRQRVNYHLRALEQAGLLEVVEERQRRGEVERVLAARADAFVIDPAVMSGPGAEVQDRHAAEHLVQTAAGVVRDVTRMQSAAQREDKRLLTFTLETEVAFAAPADIERFTERLAAVLAAAAAEFHADGGRRYRVVAGGHPAPAKESG
jgi:DNA-binding transcriptional ArsR family regulator